MNKHRLALGGELKNPFTGKAELELLETYFLGAMLTGDEANLSASKNPSMWHITYRLNNTKSCPDNKKAILDQKNLISSLLERAGITTTGEPAAIKPNPAGYRFTLKLQDGMSKDHLFGLCKEIMEADDELFAGALLVGAYDCKGHYDTKNNYLVMDCPYDQEAEIIKECLARFAIKNVKTNPPRSRSTSEPRKPQLRIKSRYLATFMREIGFAWESKRLKIMGCIPRANELPAQGRSAWYVLGAHGNSHYGRDADEDQPLLDVLKQNLSEIDDKIANAAKCPDAPTVKMSDYEHKSLERRYKRDTKTVKESLVRCGWKCELGSALGSVHETFPRLKDGKAYLEPHHLIPLKARGDFEFEIDCPANVVMLCSKCHDEVHYGKNRERLITALYESRKKRLEAAGLLKTINGETLSAEELIKMY